MKTGIPGVFRHSGGAAQMPNAFDSQVECSEALQNEAEHLSPEEQILVSGYRAMDTLWRLAIRCFLATGDDRLVLAIYFQRFLGLRPRQLGGQAADYLGQFPTPVEVDEPPLIGG